MRKYFYTSWLALGIFQLLVNFDCFQLQAQEFLFSQGPSQNLDDSKNLQVNPNPIEPSKMAVRIPRVFFEKSITGTFVGRSSRVDQGSSPISIDSPVTWEEQSTTLPAPQPGALADFRDYKGCASYNQTPIAVCFNVMPDVSSVGVNSREMQLIGIEKYMNEELSKLSNSNGCSYTTQNIQFKQASRNQNEVLIQFSGDLIPGSDCNELKQPLEIQIKLKAT